MSTRGNNEATGRDSEANQPHDKDNAMNTETSEERLRKALGAVNDLQPPHDDLFAVRALNRGRARTARRRSALLGAAAAVVVVGGVGGFWTLSQHGGGASSASAPAAPAQNQPAEGAAGGSGSTDGAARAGSPTQSSVPFGANRQGPDGLTGGDLSSAARDSSQWLQGPMTAQRIAFDAIAPTLAARWPDVFSGAYAADATNTRIVVAVVRPDPALESFVRGAMPAPSDVEFVTAANSLAAKHKVAAEIAAAAETLKSDGVDVTGIRLDGRTDRVVVTTATGSTPGVLEQRYGATVVKVVVAAVTPPVKLPNGATLPTLQP